MEQVKNAVQLMGYLGRDPEVLNFEKGGKLAKISIGTKERAKNEKGEWIEITSWHHLIGWGKTAEQMENQLRKGREIAIQGKLVQRSYNDKNGIKRYVTEVVVNEFVMVEKPKEQLCEDLPA